MVDQLNYTNILKKDYNFFSLRYFFGIGDDNYSYDSIRIIKLLHVLINIILNLIIIISIFKKKKEKFSVALILTGNVLLINLIHTFSYSFEWVLKEEDNHHIKTLYIIENGEHFNGDNYRLLNSKKYYEVGGLLVGNIEHLGACKTQGFFLIFSAISQDILINIFFYIINLPKIPSKRKITIFLILLGYCFPLLISFFMLYLEGLGINDKYCYIAKFDVNPDDDNPYKFKKIFPLLVYIIYGIRTSNLVISIFLLYKIIKYVKDNRLKKTYILKSSAILIVQVTIISIGLIYRLSSSINEDFSRKFSNIFLCINTLDGVLFPLSYSLSNKVFKILFRSQSKDSDLDSIDEDLDIFNQKKDQNNSDSNISRNSSTQKSFALFDIKDDNNFELSTYG
jgi:hypothetical protein